MRELVELTGYFAILFALSGTLAYALVTVRNRRSLERGFEPSERDVFRLRCASGMYRASFLGEEAGGWAISAPIQRDARVPIRPGERLTVEAPQADGARIFKTEVVTRLQEPHRLILKKPSRILTTDRRAEPRRRDLATRAVSVEGSDSQIVDISSKGARLLCDREFLRGERVRVDVAGVPRPLFAWILECLPNGRGSETRVMFEEPVSI